MKSVFTAPPSPAAQSLAVLLHGEAKHVAVAAARDVAVSSPLAHEKAPRHLRRVFEAAALELGRLLEAHGEEGVRLFGEKFRRRAVSLAARGLPVRAGLEEACAFQRAITTRWTAVAGPMPPAVLDLLTDLLAELCAHVADVWVRRLRLEGAALQEAALLQTVVHSLDEAIVVFEADGTVSFATPALERVVGLAPWQVVDLAEEELRTLASRFALRDREGRELEPAEIPWERARTTRRPVHEEALQLRRPDGREAVVEVFASPVLDDDERLRGTIVTLRDRTERFRTVRALENAYADLRRMHTRLLSRSQLEATGQLVRGAAHTLNNHLNVVLMRVDRLAAGAPATGEIDPIRNAVREIAAVVARLQDSAEAAVHRPARPVAIERAVREALALTHTEFGPGSSVGLDVRLPELPDVLAGTERLVELLSGLALLGRDVAARGSRLRLEGERAGAVVRLRLVAPGAPFAGAESVRLFAMPAPSGPEGGVPLAVARDEVRGWGGELDVAEAPGGGTLFTLSLRVAGEARPPESAAPVSASPARRKVLVVDDDADNAEVLSLVLGESGAEVVTAQSGAEAIAEADGEEPDVALVDLLLPDMQGWEVARELKRRHPQLRIGVVSGLAVAEAPEATGVEAVFRKPVDAHALVQFVGG